MAVYPLESLVIKHKVTKIFIKDGLLTFCSHRSWIIGKHCALVQSVGLHKQLKSVQLLNVTCIECKTLLEQEQHCWIFSSSLYHTTML